MLIKVMYVPVLVPCHPDSGWRPNLAPPRKVRAVWVGQEFWAEFFAPGGYRYLPDPQAKIINLIPTPTGRCLEHPLTLMPFGNPRGQALFLLKRVEGLEMIAKMKIAETMRHWYQSRWPAECDFAFWHSEVQVLSEG